MKPEGHPPYNFPPIPRFDVVDAQTLRVQIHEFAPEELDAIPFDPVLTPDEVEAIRAERELTLRERNRRDQRWAKVAQENAIERAFNARPVGPTTAGKLIP